VQSGRFLQVIGLGQVCTNMHLLLIDMECFRLQAICSIIFIFLLYCTAGQH